MSLVLFKILSFEGISGSGKSTQRNLLCEKLTNKEIPFEVTEWNSNPIFKPVINKIKDNRTITPLSFCLLHLCGFAIWYDPSPFWWGVSSMGSNPLRGQLSHPLRQKSCRKAVFCMGSEIHGLVGRVAHFATRHVTIPLAIVPPPPPYEPSPFWWGLRLWVRICMGL